MWTWVTFAYLTPAVLIVVSRLSGTRARSSLQKIKPLGVAEMTGCQESSVSISKGIRSE